SVTAESNRSLTAQSIGANVSFALDGFSFAAGVGVAIANATGGPSATIGAGDQIGQTGTVGGVNVAATSTDIITGQAYGVSAGRRRAAGGVCPSPHPSHIAAAPRAHRAAPPDNPPTPPPGPVPATATNTPTVNATAFGVAVAGGIALGAVVSNANVAGTTSSY